jgi:hypothetical protein
MSFYSDASLVMIPSGYKDQKVYCAVPTDGSADLTFSRASSATRVQSNGLIEKVRTNIILQSEDFTTTWASNVSPTITANTTVAPDGTTTGDTIAASGSNSGAYQVPTVANGVEHSFSVYVKNITSATAIQIGCDLGPVNGFLNFNAVTGAITTTAAGITGSSVTNVGNGWYRVSGTYITTGTTNTFIVFGQSGMTFAVWGAQLEAGVTTDYIATTTAAVSVGPVSGLPRLDYLGSTCPKLLLEPQRTNLAIYSEQFDNAGWGKTQSGTGLVPVITANNAISPDGYQNADTIVFDVGAGTTSSDISAMFQTFGGTTATYTGSFYAKTASGTAQIQVRIDGSNYDKFTITNQWQRFTLTKALTGTSNVFEMAIRRGLNEPMNATATIQLWGVQVELGAYATSYIPTLGASVTRVADAASKTSASALIGQTEGTIFWEFEFTTSVATGNEALLNIDNGSFGNTVYISKSASGGIVAEMYNGGVLQASLSLSSQPAGTYKAAIGYANNNTAFFVNGVQVGTTDTSCSVPAMSRIQLGNTAIGPSTDKTAQVLLFTTRLTNAQLAELTA